MTDFCVTLCSFIHLAVNLHRSVFKLCITNDINMTTIHAGS
jgi:hypothetical protein